MSSPGQFEVEQKFVLEDGSDGFLKRLLELGARPLDEVRQVDAYFNHPVRDFRETDEALRIRSVGEQNFLTWKGPKLSQTTKTRREIETPLGAGTAAAEQFGQVLEILSFHPVASVRKVRQRFELTRGEHTFEIAFDRVEGLGDFAEIELIADKAGLDAAQAAVLALGADLGLHKVERRSYLALLVGDGE